MPKKAWWLITLVMMMIFLGAAYAEEEPVVIDPADIIAKEAIPTNEPILSGSMNCLVGEEYTYTLVNADKATGIDIRIYPCTYTASGAYQYHPDQYDSRKLSKSGTFKYTFSESRPYLIIVTYQKGGKNRELDPFFITTSNKKAALTKKVNEIAQACRDAGAAGEYDIALWLHDYLINHAYYDLSKKEYGPDGVLLKGYGVCDSYSRAYQMLLDAFGIRNHRQEGTGNGGSHAWNVVQLEGKWYNIDVTWDDPAGEKTAVSGDEHHDYFAVPDSIFGTDHTYKITYPCTSADGSYYVRVGLPEHAALFIEYEITGSTDLGQDTMTVSADSYCKKYWTDENGGNRMSVSSLQNEIVFPLLVDYLSDQWWLGFDNQTVYRYDFVYDAQAQQFIGTKAGEDVQTAVCAWDSFPLIPNQMAVRYRFSKPVNHTQGVWLWFELPTDNGYRYQSVEVTSQEGSAPVEWDSMEPFDLTVVLGSTELAKLHAVPFSPDDGQLHLPDGLKTVGEDAFRGTAARFAGIPDGCTVIGPHAFADTDMACVVIPSSVHQIADNAFENCSAENLWLIVAEGSDADAWADQHHFHHMSFGGKVLD